MPTPVTSDQRMVDAQEARRILDRLYGYEISPVLWRKVRPKLSAGRVQSPATRILVERERERMAFVTASYWDLEGEFTVPSDPDKIQFTAALVSVDGSRVASGRDFASTGQLEGDVKLLDQDAAVALADGLADADYTVESVEAKPYTRKPYPPFRTSTLQQEAGRKLRFGTGRTMSGAQRLYESGLITYMRTDSTTLSEPLCRRPANWSLSVTAPSTFRRSRGHTPARSRTLKKLTKLSVHPATSLSCRKLSLRRLGPPQMRPSCTSSSGSARSPAR